MEEKYQEESGWDHDDLDCPEYGEIILTPKRKDLRRKELWQEEKAGRIQKKRS